MASWNRRLLRRTEGVCHRGFALTVRHKVQTHCAQLEMIVTTGTAPKGHYLENSLPAPLVPLGVDVQRWRAEQRANDEALFLFSSAVSLG